MSSPVALIFGAGKNIGAHVAKAFLNAGYKVAVASRTSQHGLPASAFLHVQCDLSDTNSVKGVFAEVNSRLGAPSVVVYNAYGHATSSEADSPIGVDVADFKNSLDINVSSVFAAAQEAVSSFQSLDKKHQKTFIFTGNRLNISPIMPLLCLGVGKAATAHLMAFLTKAYEKKDYKFFYADEREADGQPVYNRIDGAAAGNYYVWLAQGTEKVPWLATYVKGQGYKDFDETSKI